MCAPPGRLSAWPCALGVRSGQKGASPGRHPSPGRGSARTLRRRRSGPPHGASEVLLWNLTGLTARSSPHASGPVLEPLRPPSQCPQQSVPGLQTRREGDGQSRSWGRQTPDLCRCLRPQGQCLHPPGTTLIRPARLGDRRWSPHPDGPPTHTRPLSPGDPGPAPQGTLLHHIPPSSAHAGRWRQPIRRENSSDAGLTGSPPLLWPPKAPSSPRCQAEAPGIAPPTHTPHGSATSEHRPGDACMPKAW